MGKAAKAHRAKVAKRNANMKVQEKRMQKVWQEAFEEQMNAMKEKFAAMSGETFTGETENILSEEQINKLNEFSSRISEIEEKINDLDNDKNLDKLKTHLESFSQDLKDEETTTQEESKSTESISGDQTV
jgi:predicted component of type VI protein secretion system